MNTCTGMNENGNSFNEGIKLADTALSMSCETPERLSGWASRRFTYDFAG